MKPLSATIPDIITLDWLQSAVDAVVELQSLAITNVQFPLKKSGQTLSAVVPQLIQVQNNSGGDLDAFSVLGISGPLVDPGDGSDANKLADFQRRVIFTGVTPTVANHLGQFVITLAPIASGVIGPACAAGVCQVQVTVADETTKRLFAEVDDGQTGDLKAVHCGSAGILWREGGTGTQWAIVLLGKRSAGQAFAVNLSCTNTSANGDGSSTSCSFTYTVTDAITGETLVSSPVDPTTAPTSSAPGGTWVRPGGYFAMQAASAGLAHWTSDDQLCLDWINEQINIQACGSS